MQLNEEACPVPESILGQLYRSNPHGLASLVSTVAPDVRAMLAIYCYRRAHLASIGLAIAATCEEDDLTTHGGNMGSVLFAKSRQPHTPERQSHRPKISLSQGALMTVIAQDLI